MILKVLNVNIVVFGEGGLTFLKLITKMIENGEKIPDSNVLNAIQGFPL